MVVGRWQFLLPALILALGLGACSNDPKPQAPAATATAPPATMTPKPQLSACPEDVGQEICDFAAAAEGWAQAGDVQKLIAGGPLDTGEARAGLGKLLDSQLPATADAPRKLRSIACPVGRKADAPAPDCSAKFALVFATVTERTPPTDGKGLVVLGYDRSAVGFQLYGFDAPLPGWQLALIAGPMTSGETLPGTTQTGLGFRIYPVEVLPPGQQPVPTPGTGETIGGLAVKELAFGAPTSLPGGVVVYLGPAPWASDSFAVLLWRLYLGPDGTIRRDDLFANAKAQLGDLAIVGWAGDETMGQMVAVACQAGRCRGTGVGGWAGDFDVYRTTDGGISWAPFGSVPAMAFPMAVTAEGTLFGHFLGRDDNERPQYDFFRLPSGEKVTPPAPNTEPRVVPGLGLVWEPTSMDRKFGAEPSYDAFGKVIDAAAIGPNLEARLTARAGGQLYGAWTYVLDRPADPHPASVYFGRADAAGKPLALFRLGPAVPVASWLGPFLAGPGLVISNGEVEVSAGSPRPFDVPAVLIDLATGTVSPLREFDQFMNANQQPIVRGTVVAKVARVVTGGDCLNVRESASSSAPAIACYHDGVLLFERGEAVTVGGASWVPVTTPAGKEGWASAQFLER